MSAEAGPSRPATSKKGFQSRQECCHPSSTNCAWPCFKRIRSVYPTSQETGKAPPHEDHKIEFAAQLSLGIKEHGSMLIENFVSSIIVSRFSSKPSTTAKHSVSMPEF